MSSGLHEMNTRYSRSGHSRLQAAQRDVTRAQEDYQRLRSAYLDLAQSERGNEVGLAMVGADMDRAHANLQNLSGLQQLPFTHEPSQVARREIQGPHAHLSGRT